MNLSIFSVVLVFLLLVRRSEGCLVVNPRSTTVSSTEVTSTESTISGSTQSTVSTVSQSTESTVSSESTQSTDSTVSQTSQSTVSQSTDSTVSQSTDSTVSQSTDSTVSQSTDSTVSQSTDSTVTHSTQSTLSHGSTDLDFTTTISRGTTQEDCTVYCNNPDNILIPENTRFEKPSALKLPNENDDICGTYMVSCDAPGGQYCDRINLIASQTGSLNLVQLAEQDQVSVRGIVVCSGNGVFRPDGAAEEDAGFYDMTCMYTNCRNGTVPTEEPTTVSSTAASTTEPKSCATCDVQKIFDYADRTDKFQPWYHDISNDYNCMCKALDISCELYNVDTCDSHEIWILTDDGEEIMLIGVDTNKVNWQIYCQDNGEYGVDVLGRFVNIKEIYCKSENCRNSTADTTSTTVTTSTVEPTTTEVRNCKTCQASSLFDYSGEEYFQPWYRDVDGGNCNCKFNEFSCELFGNVSCTLAMEFRDTNGDSVILAEGTNKVAEQVACADSGYWEINGKQLAQIFCTKHNCV